MVLYNELLEYITMNTYDIKILMNIISRFSKSDGVAIYTNDGSIFSNKKTSCFEDTKFQNIKSPVIVSENSGNLIVIPYSKFKLCLFGRKKEYSIEIVHTLIPFVHILNGLINESNTGDMFLVNMSHEIRTPLNGVIGYAQLLERTELTKKQKSHVKSMTECSIQLMQIINNILDVSRLNSGKMGTSNECFSMKELEDCLKNILGQRISQKKQSLIFRCVSNVPEYIIADKQKVVQIMVNLISNAHKYSVISSQITVVFSLESTNMLSIQVIDEGIGIPIERMDGLYNTFSRLHSENNQDGSGLGLAICKKLSILLGGNMSVTSSLSKGSTFTTTFKFLTCDDFEKDIHKEVEVMEGRKILVVDDNVDNRILIADLLHTWGVIPTMVASAKEAISIISNNMYRFDIGLIDICMPDMNGVELARLIKNERPLLPLIALSSLDTFDHGCDFECKLNKPINKIQLYDKIQKAIASSILPDMVVETVKDKNLHSSVIWKPETNQSRILIAEDVAYNRDVLSQLVKQIGYNNIDFAFDGNQAIEKMHVAIEEDNPYKILLLDLGMPVINGFEVIDYITRMKWNLPKIIVVTADVVQGEVGKCKNLGVNYFITKPVDYNSLKRIIIQASTSML